MLTIQQIQERAYATACSKGWHDRPLRELAGDCVGDPPQIVIHHDRVLRSHALMHTEITEAFECWEAGDLALHIDGDSGKPEGMSVELADLVIRVCDTVQALGLTLDIYGDWLKLAAEREPSPALTMSGLAQSVAVLQHVGWIRMHIDRASEAVRTDRWDQYRAALTFVVAEAASLAAGLGLNFAAAIEAKMSYNETRPHRHGGKQA